MNKLISSLLFPFLIAVWMMVESVVNLAKMQLPTDAYLRVSELIIGIVLLFVLLLAKLHAECALIKVRDFWNEKPVDKESTIYTSTQRSHKYVT